MIEQLIKLYNKSWPNEALELNEVAEKQDISDVYICAYNNSVGLFESIGWRGYRLLDADYDTGIVYVGIDSDYIGMKKTRNHKLFGSIGWEPVGTVTKIDNKTYVANCQMSNSISFDDMRLIMYKNGKIGGYERGKATSREIIDVLAYAQSYFDDRKAKVKTV